MDVIIYHTHIAAPVSLPYVKHYLPLLMRLCRYVDLAMASVYAITVSAAFIDDKMPLVASRR